MATARTSPRACSSYNASSIDIVLMKSAVSYEGGNSPVDAIIFS